MKQPKTLYLLSFVQMWRFFSHYGIRALLVLFLAEHLKYSDAHAFGINAVFCGIVELSGIFGGILADRFLGLRRATWLGALLASVGYAGLIFEKGLFFGLPMIVLGSSLYSGNITALLGEAYHEGDPRRERGFTIFYMVQNLGALISTFLCGMISVRYGFPLAFAIAASGMVIGSLSLWMGRSLLSSLGQPPPRKRTKVWIYPLLLILGVSAAVIWYEKIVFPILPWLTAAIFVFFAVLLLRDQNLPKEKVRKLFIFLGGLILYFAVEDQIFSSLVLFSERMVNRTVFGWTIPSSVMLSINPIVVLLLGSLIAKVRFKMVIPFALVAASFGLISILCLKEMIISLFGVIGLVVIISAAELMIGPVAFSFASEVASKGRAGMVMGMVPMTIPPLPLESTSEGRAGMVMGMVPISFSLAFLLSGAFSKMVTIEESTSTLLTYGVGFGKIALIVLIGGCVLELFMKRFSHEKRTVS